MSGSYFESCNCDPICPCRKIGDRPGGRSTHGICFGTISWAIKQGRADDIDLSGLAVVLSIWYSDDEPGKPWQVILYVDERGDQRQREALTEIFLGRAGGNTLRNYANAIAEVHAVRPATIELQHGPEAKSIRVGDLIRVRATEPFETDQVVACGIPGFDRPGQEMWAEILRSDDPPFQWELTQNCAFATNFAYDSNE